MFTVWRRIWECNNIIFMFVLLLNIPVKNYGNVEMVS